MFYIFLNFIFIIWAVSAKSLKMPKKWKGHRELYCDVCRHAIANIYFEMDKIESKDLYAPVARLSGSGERITNSKALTEVFLYEAIDDPCKWNDAFLRKHKGREYVWRGTKDRFKTQKKEKKIKGKVRWDKKWTTMIKGMCEDFMEDNEEGLVKNFLEEDWEKLNNFCQQRISTKDCLSLKLRDYERNRKDDDDKEEL